MTNLNDKMNELEVLVKDLSVEPSVLSYRLGKLDGMRFCLDHLATLADAQAEIDDLKESLETVRSSLKLKSGTAAMRNTRIKKLVYVNRIMREALEFYADKKNWDERWKSSCDEECEGDVSDVIDEQDVDVEDLGCGPVWTYGGKRARECLKGLE